MESIATTTTVAYCGLYCPRCGCTRWGECAGCKSGGGFDACGVRLCATDRGFATCAECQEMDSCKKLDNFLGRIYSVVFRTRRMENLREIRTIGLEAFATSRARGPGVRG